MERIFGKGMRIACILSMQLFATVRVQLQTAEGQTTTQAVAGVPFFVQVTISDVQLAQEPVLEGLENFVVQRAGYQVMVINGARSVQYRYQVRIDTPGTYQIGPVHAGDPQESAPAQMIAVTSAQQATQTSSGRRYAQAQPVVELVVDKDHVYVGQKLRATLRILISDGERISLEPIVLQQMPALTVYHTSELEQQQVMLQGKGYNLFQLHLDMYPNSAGRVVIPAHFIDYIKEKPMDAFLGSFAALLGSHYERKRIYSNTVTLDVLPLPVSDEPVSLVGQLNGIALAVEPMVARQYEGIVLKYTLEGDLNFSTLVAPELVDIPTGLKYYPSRSDLQDIPNGQRYTAEYIVQGLQAGDYEIPAQSVTYFDTQTGTYKTKATAPLFITILPSEQSADVGKKAESAAVTPVQQVSKEEEVVHTSPLASLCQTMDSGERGVMHNGLPWWVLIGVALIGLLLWHWHVIVALLQKQLLIIAPTYAKRRLYANLRTAMEHAVQTGDMRRIQQIIVQAVEIATSKRMHTPDVDALSVYADTTDWSFDKRQHWQKFLHNLTEQLYAEHDREQNKQICATAQLWLEEIERQAL